MMIRKILFVFILQYTCPFLWAQKVHDFVRLSELILSERYSESMVTLSSDYCIARIEEGDNTVCLLLSKTTDERYEVVLRKDFICEIENSNQYVFYTEEGENVLYDIVKNKEIKFQQDFDNIVYLCSTNEGDYFFTGDIIRSDGWVLPLRDGCEVSLDKDKVILSYGINKFDINTLLRKAMTSNPINNIIKVFYKHIGKT